MSLIQVTDEATTHVTIGGGCGEAHAVEQHGHLRGVICRFCAAAAEAFGFTVLEDAPEAGHETAPEPEIPVGDEEPAPADSGEAPTSEDAQSASAPAAEPQGEPEPIEPANPDAGDAAQS